jgi:hypothetical protein
MAVKRVPLSEISSELWNTISEALIGETEPKVYAVLMASFEMVMMTFTQDIMPNYNQSRIIQIGYNFACKKLSKH